MMLAGWMRRREPRRREWCGEVEVGGYWSRLLTVITKFVSLGELLTGRTKALPLPFEGHVGTWLL